MDTKHDITSTNDQDNTCTRCGYFLEVHLQQKRNKLPQPTKLAHDSRFFEYPGNRRNLQ